MIILAQRLKSWLRRKSLFKHLGTLQGASHFYKKKESTEVLSKPSS
jgi:hypothetical protein